MSNDMRTVEVFHLRHRLKIALSALEQIKSAPDGGAIKAMAEKALAEIESES